MEEDCCRICLSKTQSIERQELFLQGESSLSILGQLYEEVLNLPLADMKITLKYICNSCGLQLKLFKQLKNKALETYLFLTDLLNAAPYMDHDNNVESDENIQFDADTLLSTTQTEAQNVVENQDNTSIVEYSDCQEIAEHENNPTENDITETETDIIENDFHENDIPENEIAENDDMIENLSDENALTKILHEMEENISQQIEEYRDDEEYGSVEEFNKNEEQICLDTSDEEDYEICYLEDDMVLENPEKQLDQEKYNEECEEANLYDMITIKNTKPVKEILCPYCDETFSLKSQLRIHEKKLHSLSTKIQCHLCTKVLFSKETYQAHMNVHDGLPAYQCNICDKAFNQKVHYNYHMLNHKNERNNICDVCQKGFISSGDLKTHMRSHTDERRYKCDICDKRFRAHTHMVNHRYSHFEKQFECPVCFQKYMSPNTLRTHFKDVHSTEVPFECEFCEKRFKRKHHLQAHYRTHGKAIGSISILDD